MDATLTRLVRFADFPLRKIHRLPTLVKISCNEGVGGWYVPRNHDRGWGFWFFIVMAAATLFGVISSAVSDDNGRPSRPSNVYEVCEDRGSGGYDCYEVRSGG